MTRLHDLQASFMSAVRGGDPKRFLVSVAGDMALMMERLDVYRGNYAGNLAGALRISYPVVEQLVGRDFFDYAVRAFIAATPSRSANLEEYGADFPDFLDRFDPAAGVPYLADVARLEAAIDAVFAAPDPAPSPRLIDTLALADRPACVRLAPHARLLRSPYPVDRIWGMHQPGGDDRVDLESGPVRLIVLRMGTEPVLAPAAPAEFAFLEAMARGASLIEAMVDAAAHDLVFDASAALQAALDASLLVVADPSRIHPLPERPFQ